MANNWYEYNGVAIDWTNFNVQNLWHYCRVLQLAFCERMKLLHAFHNNINSIWTNTEWRSLFFYGNDTYRLKRISYFCNIFDDAFWKQSRRLSDHFNKFCDPNNFISGTYPNQYIKTLTNADILSYIGQSSWIDSRTVGINCNDLSWFTSWATQYKRAFNLLKWPILTGSFPQMLTVTYYYKSATSYLSWADACNQFNLAPWNIYTGTYSGKAGSLRSQYFNEVPAYWTRTAFRYNVVSNFSAIGMLADVEHWRRADTEPWINRFISIDGNVNYGVLEKIKSFLNCNSFSDITFSDVDFMVDESLDPCVLGTGENRGSYNLHIGKFDIPGGLIYIE